MKNFPRKKGLIKLNNSVYAYMQPSGSWGLNNAGLVTDNGRSLIIDTLYDLKLTAEMLNEIKEKTGLTEFDYLINTHANGDHFYGNQIIKTRSIIASKECSLEMKEMPPEKMNMLMNLYWLLGPGGRFAKSCFKDFNFSKIKLVLPDKTFENEMFLEVGNKHILLKEVGPSHTMGDVIVFIKDDNILFASDQLFIKSVPLIWEGPVSNFIKSLDYMISLNPDIIIPGHGPVTDINGIEKTKELVNFVVKESKKGFKANKSIVETAVNINLDSFNLEETEKIITIVNTVYRKSGSKKATKNVVKIFNMMAAYKKLKAKNRS